MEDSILTSIKQMLGVGGEDVEAFDTELIIHINSNLMTLSQIGVGKIGFKIKDKRTKWKDFTAIIDQLEAIKQYVYMKVRLIFDPPSNSTVIETYKQECEKIEFRLQVRVESEIPEDEE